MKVIDKLMYDYYVFIISFTVIFFYTLYPSTSLINKFFIIYTKAENYSLTKVNKADKYLSYPLYT